MYILNCNVIMRCKFETELWLYNFKCFLYFLLGDYQSHFVYAVKWFRYVMNYQIIPTLFVGYNYRAYVIKSVEIDVINDLLLC